MKVIRDRIATASGPVFTDDGRANSLYLNELFDAIAKETAARLRRRYRAEVPLTGGLWGGSWYFTDERGYTRARFRRLYSLVCVPQVPSLNDAENYNIVFWQYSKVLAEAFAEYGIALEDAQWGESIPYSNRLRPLISLQMWDANKKIDFIRCFFSYNSASWEEAYLYETVRLIQQTKEALDSRAMTDPPRLEGMAVRFQLQDIVILYSTLEPMLSTETKALAGPLVERIKSRFAQGMNDEEEMRSINAEAFKSGLIYGYEEAIRQEFVNEGLDITKIEDWPVERINRVPESLKLKLIPPLKAIFKGFREQLKTAGAARLSGTRTGR
ncbi:MAG TPA: hypothetical protein VGJ57_03165 [Nitrospirales bacterium]|jgi:hypothetical protein